MMLADSQRRRVTRGLFVALCIVPVIVIGVAGWMLRSALHRANWEREFSTLLGLRIAIDAVSYPRPGTVRFERFRGYDPETDAAVLDCRLFEAEEFADGQHLHAAQAEIFADRAVRLFDAIQRRLRRELPGTDSTVTFGAEELTWHAGGTSQTVLDLNALAGPAESSQQLLLDFRLPETPKEHPVTLRISRVTETVPTTSIEIDTGAVVLPCAMFAPLSDGVASLGPRALFTGRLKLRETADGWDGIVTGDIAEADLDTLVSRRFPHTLSGSAELRIHRAEIERSRLERMQLTVLAGPGQIGRSLIAAGGQHLGLCEPSAIPTETMVLFDRLVFDATWDRGALLLKARPTERPPAILWKDATVYWREPSAPATAANLLRTLLPDRDLLVPAAAQTASLLRWLPLGKSTTPGTTDDNGTPRVRVRGVGEALEERR
jgi:hypothetical protein